MNSLLDVLSTTIETLHSKEWKDDPSLAPSSLVPEKKSQRIQKRKQPQVEAILDSKIEENNRWYNVRYRGANDNSNEGTEWVQYENLDCEPLIEEFEASKGNSKQSVPRSSSSSSISSLGNQLDTDVTKRNLDAVKDALKVLGGRAFGGAIVDWICSNREDMLSSFGDDKKKLRYCVNGLLSARVNSSIFEKKVYKENGSTKTEWLLAESSSNDTKNDENGASNSASHSHEATSDEDLANLEDANFKISKHSSEESLSSLANNPLSSASSSTSTSPSPLNQLNTNAKKPIANKRIGRDTKLRTSNNNTLLMQVIKEERNHIHRSNSSGNIASSNGNLVGNPQKRSRSELTNSRSFDILNGGGGSSSSMLSMNGVVDEDMNDMDDDEDVEDNEVSEENDVDASDRDPVIGGVPQTYRGMIKVALEFMGGYATFEAISKFIGTKFKDQLSNKAETWKHSIAGCLSVYFARKDQKDPSGKVIWTLGDPPKPKRRGRKRDRDDHSPPPEREITISTKSKRRKDDSIHSNSNGHSNGHGVSMISIEQYEALEEENETLKSLIAKKKREETNARNSTYLSQEPCECCKERKELCMILNPCGHIFCGNYFCEATTSSVCNICNATITGRLPVRRNRGKRDKDNYITNHLTSSQSNINISSSNSGISYNNNVNTNSIPISTSTSTYNTRPRRTKSISNSNSFDYSQQDND